MPVTDSQLHDLARRLTGLGGVAAVLLGGSRARGDHTPVSDVDLGLYYRRPLDVDALRILARDVAGPQADVTEPGAWGPWVDGGGWLHIAGSAVDWIYRDLDRVHEAWSDAQQGRFDFHAQAGHPLGVPDFAYAGEVALGVVLDDPTGELTSLQARTRAYPPRLAEALVARLWEAGFLVDCARKAVGRADTTYVAGCLFRSTLLCAHALHGGSGRWLVNEKGAVAGAGRLPGAPRDFAVRAQAVLARLGTTPSELARAVEDAAALVFETSAACRGSPPRG